MDHPKLEDSCYKLFVECPWRAVEQSRLVFGSDDLRFYWEEFQDDMGSSPFAALFVEVLGLETYNGGVISKKVHRVEDVAVDSMGGVGIAFSSGLSIQLLPAGHFDVQWILSHSRNGSLALRDGLLK